jgi:hypothetical protein
VYEGNAEVAYLVEEGKVEVPLNTGVPREKLSFVERLVRGASRLAALTGRPERGGKPQTEEVVALVARKVTVEVLDNEEGFMRVQASGIGDGALVILNPRDAIRDGTRVSIVGDEGD